MADLLLSEELRSRSQDVCDFCEVVFVADEKNPHTCLKMPIERILDGERFPNYGTLVSCLGAIVVDVSDDDYQGDNRWLIRGHDGRWGVLVSGYGSCSGCDALQACSEPSDFDDLRSSLAGSTQWFDTAQACSDYLTGKDWETHHSWREIESRAFVEQCLAKLGLESNGGAKDPKR